MNKLLFTILPFVLFSISIFGQSDDDNPTYGYERELTIEPFISLSSSGLLIDNDFLPKESVYNFAAGVFVDYHFNPRWSIRSGIIYDKMGDGSFFFTDANGVPIREGFGRNYISIPIMANWHFGKRKRWNLGFGVTQSFGSEDELFGSITGTDELKSFLSSTIEIGYSFPVGPGFIHISSNGINSFSKIADVFAQSRNLTSVGYVLRM